MIIRVPQEQFRTTTARRTREYNMHVNLTSYVNAGLDSLAASDISRLR